MYSVDNLKVNVYLFPVNLFLFPKCQLNVSQQPEVELQLVYTGNKAARDNLVNRLTAYADLTLKVKKVKKVKSFTTSC